MAMPFDDSNGPRHLMTVEEHIIRQQRAHPTASGSFSWLLSGITLAGRIISAQVRRAGILDVLGDAGNDNVHGEQQQKLDVLANRTIEMCLAYRGNVGIIASEELNEPTVITKSGAAGRYVVVFDPLDGSSNIDVNVRWARFCHL
jgi:fructose-1,6-bisphosphatase I